MNALQNTNNLRANSCNGVNQFFTNPFYKFKYSDGVRDIAIETESFWFLDVISSYQNNLTGEVFQSWKLEREYSFSEVDGIKIIHQRKDCFNVVCDDGNGNVLITQHIPLSDFVDDIYTLFLLDGVLILPEEY